MREASEPVYSPTYMRAQSRCWECGYALTQVSRVVMEAAEEHLSMGCPGPVIIMLKRPKPEQVER